MKKLFLLFSHTLTPTQEQDAKESMGIEENYLTSYRNFGQIFLQS